MMISPNELRLAKHFLICKKSLLDSLRCAAIAHWSERAFGPDLVIAHHPALEVSRVSEGGVEVLSLGEVLDPRNPSQDTREVISSLARTCTKFTDIERAISWFGGRWLLLVRYGADSFAYHDAGGLRTLFRYERRGGGVLLASHPSVFEAVSGLVRNESFVNDFLKGQHSGSWPVYALPFEHVVQMLPNRRMNLESFGIERYWPNNEMSPLGVGEAARTIAQLLQGMMAACVARRKCFLPLSAGYDSRVLFACAKPFREQIKYYTVAYPGIDAFDLRVPATIGKQFRLDYRRLTMRRDADIDQVLSANVSDMFPQDSRFHAFTQGLEVRDGFCLVGLVSEVLRCFYYPDGQHPDTLDGVAIAYRAGFRDNPVAVAAMSRWLEELPRSWVNPLDVFYWEHRVGVWASTGLTLRQPLYENIPPFNCRQLLELGLRVDVEYRKKPYHLHRAICQEADPQTLQLGFNSEMAPKYFQVRRLVPARVRQILKRYVVRGRGL